MKYIKPPKETLDTEFENLISGYTEHIREISIAARNLMYSILPGLTEIIWHQQKICGYGTGPKKMSEHFCYIAPCKNHVNVGFHYGSELTDPDGLMEGTGKLMRHIKIKKITELDNPALTELIQHATNHRVPPLLI
jgi:hypothetical protein